MQEDEETRLLFQMLELARRLSASTDPMLAGQYRHLEGRIAALLSVKGTDATPMPVGEDR